MTVTTEIGKARARKEDARLVTGQTTWTDNIQLPGMVHIAFVRSPMAHARIARVDVSAARSAPGVIAAFSGADFAAEQGSLPCAWPVTPDIVIPAHPPMATDEVRYVGEIVACVVARDHYAAADALEKIDVDELERVRRGVVVAGDHAGHDLADVADLVGGHRRVRRDDDVRRHRPGAGQAALFGGEVGAGERGDDAGRAAGGRHVHRPDPGVRHRAAHVTDVQHPRQHDVVGPVGLPGEQPRVLLARPRLADLGGDRHDGAPSDAARTMFW